jgi:hypothetical protein
MSTEIPNQPDEPANPHRPRHLEVHAPRCPEIFGSGPSGDTFHPCRVRACLGNPSVARRTSKRSARAPVSRNFFGSVTSKCRACRALSALSRELESSSRNLAVGVDGLTDPVVEHEVGCVALSDYTVEESLGGDRWSAVRGEHHGCSSARTACPRIFFTANGRLRDPGLTHYHSTFQSTTGRRPQYAGRRTRVRAHEGSWPAMHEGHGPPILLPMMCCRAIVAGTTECERTVTSGITAAMECSRSVSRFSAPGCSSADNQRKRCGMPASASSRIGVAIAGCIPTISIETEGPHHGVVAEEPGVSGVNDLEGLGGLRSLRPASSEEILGHRRPRSASLPFLGLGLVRASSERSSR